MVSSLSLFVFSNTQNFCRREVYIEGLIFFFLQNYTQTLFPEPKKMVLSTTKRTASVASLVNQNQGGGSKKAGLPYIVGRSSASSLVLKYTPPLTSLRQTMFFTRNTVRPVDGDVRIPMR